MRVVAHANVSRVNRTRTKYDLPQVHASQMRSKPATSHPPNTVATHESQGHDMCSLSATSCQSAQIPTHQYSSLFHSINTNTS
jgi:hypothetical protein